MTPWVTFPEFTYFGEVEGVDYEDYCGTTPSAYWSGQAIDDLFEDISRLLTEDGTAKDFPTIGAPRKDRAP